MNKFAFEVGYVLAKKAAGPGRQPAVPTPPPAPAPVAPPVRTPEAAAQLSTAPGVPTTNKPGPGAQRWLQRATPQEAAAMEARKREIARIQAAADAGNYNKPKVDTIEGLRNNETWGTSRAKYLRDVTGSGGGKVKKPNTAKALASVGKKKEDGSGMGAGKKKC